MVKDIVNEKMSCHGHKLEGTDLASQCHQDPTLRNGQLNEMKGTPTCQEGKGEEHSWPQSLLHLL